jgi:hypothetical protein
VAIKTKDGASRIVAVRGSTTAVGKRGRRQGVKADGPGLGPRRRGLLRLAMPGRPYIGGRLSWVLAWLLALAAPAVYLLWPESAMWWLGLVLLMPLIGLAAWRQETKGFTDEQHVGDGGPWSPPPV